MKRRFKLVFFVNDLDLGKFAVEHQQCIIEIDPEEIAEIGRSNKSAVPGLTDEQVAVFEASAIGDLIDEAMVNMQTFVKLKLHEHLAARASEVVGA